jgi:sodium-dependent dicarboxylate transporter 2/3/5
MRTLHEASSAPCCSSCFRSTGGNGGSHSAGRIRSASTGIILLYGAGLALGELAFATGLARWLGDSITAWLPVRTELALTIVFAGLAITLSEATSNMASANMIVPVAIAVAQAAHVDPLQPALAATLGASMGFMMPISTAPNAIVYSSGYVPITAMMRHGLLLDLLGFLLIVAALTLLVPLATPS